MITLFATELQAPAAMFGEPGSGSVSLELAWDPAPEPNVVGFKVYIGTSSGQYGRIEEAGVEASHTVNGLERGLTYYFAVSAFNDQGVEGPLSDELVVVMDPPPLPVNVGIINDPFGSGDVLLRWEFPRSALGSSPEIIIQQSTDLAQWTDVDVVWSGDYVREDGGNVSFEWPIPAAGGGSMFYRLTARNWLGGSTVP